MVLVTGGAGLVGMELIGQLLASGKKVRALYNKNLPSVQHPDLELVPCSILDVIGMEEALKGIDEVYHCAALVSFAPGSAGILYKINVEGTANVVNASLDAGVRKMVHVSSVSALGRLRKDALITEDMQWTEETSNSKYGESKYRGELEVWRGIAEGLEAVIVNPTIILGAGDWNNGSTALFKSVYNEFPWYSEGVSGFVDVRDVAAAMIMLMKSDVSGERFILNGSSKTYRHLFNEIAKCFNKKPPSRKVTPMLASLAWRWESLKSKWTGKAPLVTKETAATSFAKANFDNSKLLRLFPSFRYRLFEESIKENCMLLQQKVNKQ